jgi:hypothetical protein
VDPRQCCDMEPINTVRPIQGSPRSTLLDKKMHKLLLSFSSRCHCQLHRLGANSHCVHRMYRDLCNTSGYFFPLLYVIKTWLGIQSTVEVVWVLLFLSTWSSIYLTNSLHYPFPKNGLFTVRVQTHSTNLLIFSSNIRCSARKMRQSHEILIVSGRVEARR